jgi:glycosyltransferase involved in cell wall biosynthesis
MMPLTISVAMCTFNGDSFLAPQLESIAAQDCPPDELVVCDDGSTDTTLETLRNFARRAPFPVRVEINPANLGSTRNFEKCISRCQGSIVALADQDDIWYPHKLRKLEVALRESDEIVAAFSDADIIDDDSRRIGLRLWASFGLDHARQRKFAAGHAPEVLCNHPVITGATLAFRRDRFHRMRPIPTNQFHDAWITFLLAASGKFALVREPLMQYRRHRRQQVGPGASSLRFSAQIAEVIKRNRGRRSEEMAQFQQLYEMLYERAESFPNAEAALRELQGKLAHLARRARMPELRIARPLRVLHEILVGSYWRYSNGWKSAAKDLILP